MDLPPPWEIRESAKYPGRCYYFNTTTQESYWIRPIAYPGHRTTPWPPAVYLLHILVRFLRANERSDVVTRTREQAQDRIKQLCTKLLVTSQSFDDLARTESDDDETREAGGVLGWIKRGTMPPEFEKMAWQLKVGEMAPVETKMGWHLILRRG
jgi:hypothetical protein